MSILFADSNCDIKSNQIKQFGIEYINMPFSCSNNEIDLVSVDFFEETFKPYLEQGNNLIYVHQGEFYFNSYANLKKAIRRLKTEYPDNTIYLVDSEATSAGYAFIVYLAMLKYKTGCNEVDLVNYINKIKKEVAVLFTLNNAKELNKKGVNITIENALVKPVIKVENNKFEVVEKVTNRNKTIQSFLNGFTKFGENVADYPVFISYSGNEIDAKELVNAIEQTLGKDVKILVNTLSEYNTHFTSAKTLFIAFHKKVD